MLEAVSEILYVRASLKPLARQIGASGGVLNYLHSKISFKELFAPHFYNARPIWRRPLDPAQPRKTNSGSLGKLVAKSPGSALSRHPTHTFAGIGKRVCDVLAKHNANTSCFEPISELADRYDFSMLLLGCLDESPGFSTVHVAQNRLGLSQRHLLRLLLRWDDTETNNKTLVAAEAPGCSLSFDKFYPYYEANLNLVRGNWGGVNWLFVPSARKALETELNLLRSKGRFVDCRRLTCASCRLRWY